MSRGSYAHPHTQLGNADCEPEPCQIVLKMVAGSKIIILIVLRAKKQESDPQIEWQSLSLSL